MNIFNLLLIITAGLFFSLPLMSAEEKDPDFQTEKNREIGNVKERLQIIEGRLNCMKKSNDFESLKTCNQGAVKKMDALEAKINAQERNKIQADNKNKQPENKAPANKQQDNKKLDSNIKPN
ncbi:hypothetical protein [Nitrosomonas supralitoralis]|uniref:Uncharacterized protein n=1 Tax=Nitrosomonas supralitoralis TaxID=2116706 RepID=A0A2P7NVX7_9PROT|nr:hypothetical protein [Nitrosomonas supralitoralis]PSJ17624.1 hypothetical protein C7H79_06890 [Nitrosomonas supralitoralis]